MYRLIIGGFLGWISCMSLWACDVCGCTIGGMWSPFPQYHMNLVSAQFDSWHYAYPSYQTTDWTWQSTIWVRYYLNPKLQLNARLPFQQSVRTGPSQNLSLIGLADTELSGYYQAFGTSDTSSSGIYQQLWLGGGLSMPTGLQAPSEEENGLPRTFYMSAGSWGAFVEGIYQLNVRKWILQAQSRYQYQDYDASGYRRGAMSVVNLTAYRTFSVVNVGIMPMIGLQQEWLARDVDNGFYQTRTGGTASWGQLGCILINQRFQLNVTGSIPLIQDFAQGDIQADWRVGAGVAFQF